MKNTLIIFGNISFQEENGKPVSAIIHEITTTLLCPQKSACNVADQLVNIYDSYVIPELYTGKIIWDDGLDR